VGGEREGAEWGVREGWRQGGEMTQALYAHMNNKTIKKNLFPQDIIKKSPLKSIPTHIWLHFL
jgi:hypothetical protein